MSTAATEFEALNDRATDGGIEISAYFCRFGNQVLFRFSENAGPSPDGLAAAIEMVRRYRTEPEFAEALETYCISIGAAIHDVDKPAWQFRDAPDRPHLSVV